MVAAIGLLVATGWLCKVSAITGIDSGRRTMKFNTALLFFTLGVALLVQVQNSLTKWKTGSKILALPALLFSLLNLAQYVFGYNFGFDQLVVTDPQESVYPGRMALASSICFSIISLALLVAGTSKKTLLNAIQYSLHAITLIALIALVGYLFNVPGFYDLPFFSSLAVFTALAFFFLSIAVTLLNPDAGLAGLFTRDKIGNEMVRQMVLPVVLLVLVLGFLRLWAVYQHAIGPDFGVVWLILLLILGTLLIIERSVKKLDQLDAYKTEAENNLSRLKIFLDSTPDPILLLDSTGMIRLANKRAETVFGYTFSEMAGRDIKMLVPQRLYPQMTQYRLNFLEAPGGVPETRDIEIDCLRKDGTEFVAEATLNRIQSGDGIFLSVDIRDASVRKAQQLQLNRLATIINSSTDAIISKNLSGHILTWNKGAENILDYSLSEVEGKHISIIFPPELLAEEEMLMYKVLNGQPVDQYETVRVKKDGTRVRVSITLSPVKDEHGNTVAVSKILHDISTRKKTEQELKVASDRLLLATTSSGVGIWELNLLDNSLYWSESMYKIYGVVKENFTGMHQAWRSAVHPDDIEPTLQQEQMALNGEKEFDTEFRVVWPDGSIKYIKARGIVQRDAGGKPLRMVGTNWDITAQKEAEFELQKSNERNRIFVDQAPNALAMFDTHMRYMAASRKWREDYNLGNMDIIGRSHYEVFPEIGEDWKTIHRRVLTGHIDTCPEAPFERADGTTQWITWDVRPWYVVEGQIGGLLMYTADITQAKEKDAERRRIERILERTNHIARIATWEVNAITNKATWSPLASIIFEMPVGDHPGRDYAINNYLPEHSRIKFLQQVSEQMKTGRPYDIEIEIITAKGNTKWLRVIGEAEFKNGECIRRFGVFQDITRNKEAETALNRANEELKAIFNAGYVSIISTDTNGLITHFNKGAESLLQYNAAEVVGRHTPALIHVPDEVAARGEQLSKQFGRTIQGFDVFVEKAKQGDHESREWTYVRKDGSQFPVQLIVSAMRNRAGIITGFLGVATDITERKAYEQKLRNYSILEAKSKEMEQFAYVTSHDLREPLLTIKSFVQLLVEDYGEHLQGEEARFITNSIIRAAARMEAVIQGLLDYSRLSRIKQLQPVDCNQVMQDVKADLNALINNNQATVQVSELPTLNAYPLELKLLLQNLVNNAIKFRKKDVAPVVQVHATPVEGGWQFCITDNGIGIEEKHRQKIFSMFQRLHSREEYEGTGIGLAQCKKIAELHNGQIWVESEPGSYSRFCFTILT